MKKHILKKVKLTIVLIPLVFVLMGFVAIKSDYFEIAKQIEIYSNLFKVLNQNYVDDISPTEVTSGAIKTMLKTLDPYTVYWDEHDVQSGRLNAAGAFGGFGAEIFTTSDNRVLIKKIYKDNAADKSGLKVGDQILSIDGLKLEEFEGNNIGVLINGTEGKSSDISYKRNNKTMETVLERKSLEIGSVPLKKMMTDNIGYLYLTTFDRSASYNVLNAMEELKAEGATSFIIDLRNNGGGLLDQAVKIVNIFAPKNTVVVSTKSNIEKFNSEIKTRSDPKELDTKVVVLINRNSASASEIVSGGLQDLDRGVIIGDKSFGKGLVQRVFDLPYGSQFKVTISKYYTPSGRCIQALDYFNKNIDGSAMKIEEDKKNAFKTSTGRTVYDGGGVDPDIEVKVRNYSNISLQLEGQNIIFDYVSKFFYEKNIPLERLDKSVIKLNEFKEFVKKSNFKFHSQTETLVEKASAKAVEENLSKELQKSFNDFLKSFNESLSKEIDRNSEEIIDLIYWELLSHYKYVSELQEAKLVNDKQVEEAVRVLSSDKEYKGILKK